MRLVSRKGVLLLFVLLTALAFALREAPEISILGDDVSNVGEVTERYEVSAPRCCSLFPRASLGHPSHTGEGFTSPNTRAHSSLVPPMAYRVRTGQDFLHWLCVQRK
jgi:hypothetical protein